MFIASWTTRSLPRNLRTTTGSHLSLQALSHRTHHQSLQPLPACCWGWFQCPPLEQRQSHSRVASLLDRFVKQRRRGTTHCRAKHCLSSARNCLCWCQVAKSWPYADGWTFKLFVPYQKSQVHPRCLACIADSSNWPENIQNMQFM